MWARQQAWLNSPVKDGSGKATTTTRAQQIKGDGGVVRLPEVQAAHLLTVLIGAGMCLSGGVSAAPITSTELTSWCNGAGRTLAPWEFTAVLSASRAYVNQLHSESATPPYGDTSDLSNPDVLSQKFARSLGGLARPVKRNAKAKGSA